MSYPVTDPVSAPLDLRGFPIPPGWVQSLHEREGGNVFPSYKSLAENIECPEDLLEQNPCLMGAFFKNYLEILSHLHWLAIGQPSSIEGWLPPGELSVNFSHVFLCYGSLEGNVLTLDSTPPEGYSDPRKLYAALAFTPAWASGTGQPAWTEGLFSVQPGWQVQHNGWVARILAVRFVGDTTIITLNRALPRSSTAPNDFRIAGEIGDIEVWPHLQPSRPLWTKPVSTGWLTPTEIGNLSEYFLTGYRIAHRGAAGSFQVFGREASSSTVVDITSLVDSWTTWSLSTGFLTWVAFPETGYDLFDVHYCREVLWPSDPSILPSDHVRVRSLKACRWCLRDFTEVFGSSGLSWAALDSDGHSWTCGQHYAGADLTQFNAECENTKCVYYESMSVSGGWKPDIGEFRNLLMGHNLCTHQIVLGDSDIFLFRGEGKFPSISWAAGMRFLVTSGLYVRNVAAFDGYFGYVDKTTSPENPYWDFITGAVLEDSNGVIAKAGFLGQSVDVLGNTPDDGTDYAEIWDSYRPFREPPLSPAWPRSENAGWIEKYVQRIRNRSIVFNAVSLRTEDVQTFEDDHTITVVLSDRLLTLVIHRTVPYEDFAHIDSQGLYVYSAAWTGGLMVLQFSPIVESCRYYLGPETNGTKSFLTCGGTVNPPEHKRQKNYGMSALSTGIGIMEKLRKGATIRFPGAPPPLNDVRLTCLAAQAFAGAKYVGTIDGTPSSVEPEGPGFVGNYEDYRLKMDTAWFDGSDEAVTALLSWLSAQSSMTQQVAVDMQPVLPPAYCFNSSGYRVNAPHDLTLYRTAPGGSSVEITDYTVDHANGKITINTSGWDVFLDYEIQVHGEFLDMIPSRPAEFFTGIRTAIRGLEWCKITGGFGPVTGIKFGIVHKFTGVLGYEVFLTPPKTEMSWGYRLDDYDSILEWDTGFDRTDWFKDNGYEYGWVFWSPDPGGGYANKITNMYPHIPPGNYNNASQAFEIRLPRDFRFGVGEFLKVVARVEFRETIISHWRYDYDWSHTDVPPKNPFNPEDHTVWEESENADEETINLLLVVVRLKENGALEHLEALSDLKTTIHKVVISGKVYYRGMVDLTEAVRRYLGTAQTYLEDPDVMLMVVPGTGTVEQVASGEKDPRILASTVYDSTGDFTYSGKNLTAYSTSFRGDGLSYASWNISDMMVQVNHSYLESHSPHMQSGYGVNPTAVERNE